MSKPFDFKDVLHPSNPIEEWRNTVIINADDMKKIYELRPSMWFCVISVGSSIDLIGSIKNFLLAIASGSVGQKFKSTKAFLGAKYGAYSSGFVPDEFIKDGIPDMWQDEWFALFIEKSGSIPVNVSWPDWLPQFLPFSKLKDPDVSFQLDLWEIKRIRLVLFNVDIFNIGIPTDLAAGGIFYPLGLILEVIVLILSLYLIFKFPNHALGIVNVLLQVFQLWTGSKFRTFVMTTLITIRTLIKDNNEKLRDMQADMNHIIAELGHMASAEFNLDDIINKLDNILSKIGVKLSIL